MEDEYLDRDYYADLGVSPSASRAEIEAVFRSHGTVILVNRAGQMLIV